MPNQHKTPLLGWHPPAELAAWARDEAARRGVPLRVILDEALTEYRDSRSGGNHSEAATVSGGNHSGEPEGASEIVAALRRRKTGGQG